MLGLRWRDVDFDLAQLSVANTIAEAGSEDIMGPPKTAKSRRHATRRITLDLYSHVAPSLPRTPPSRS